VYISRRKREDLANCYSLEDDLLTVFGHVALSGTRGGQVVERDHRRFAKMHFAQTGFSQTRQRLRCGTASHDSMGSENGYMKS
jgi:hypothetical protein